MIINTAPNEIIDFEALDSQLARGKFTYIFDHSDEMSEDKLRRLSLHSNCIIYPPIAYLSDEAQAAKQEMFVANVENFLKGDPSSVVEPCAQ